MTKLRITSANSPECPQCGRRVSGVDIDRAPREPISSGFSIRDMGGQIERLDLSPCGHELRTREDIDAFLRFTPDEGRSGDARDLLGLYASHNDKRTAEMVNWLRIVWASDELVTQGAIDPERPGEQWEWIDPATDTPAGPDPHGYYHGASLRTVEHFPFPRVADLPAFIIHSVDQMKTGAAAHIKRHDPRDTLARIEAEREIADLWERMITNREETSREVVDLMRSHPGPVPSPEFTAHTERKAALNRHSTRMYGICEGLNDVIARVAYGYRHREGYKPEEWAP